MNYDFIIDGLNFSYSNISTFEQCQYAWKLTYIDAKERNNNFWGKYGTFIHEVLEKYFKKELADYELMQYFKKNYSKNVDISGLPGFLYNMAEKNYLEGLDYFKNFDETNIDNLEVYSVEDKVYAKEDDFNVVFIPDLIVKDKDTGEYILIDFKTSDPYKNKKPDQEKIDGYKKQTRLYSYFIKKHKGVPISKINIWYIRTGHIDEFEYTDEIGEEVYQWFSESIKKIKQEEKWLPNNSNEFFCKYLCSVSQHCKYKP